MRLLSERLPQGILVAALCGLPWFFGGVDGSTLFFLAVALTVAFACTLVRPSQSATSWASLRLPAAVLGTALGLAVVQQSTPAGEWIRRLLPEASSIAADFARDPHDTADAARPLSLHAVSTRRQAAELAGAVAAFLLGAVLFSDRRNLLGLFVVVAAAGAAVAFFGILQKLSWNGLIYWKYSAELGMPFGPFINRNNAGAFLELGLSCSAGLAVWQFLNIPPLPGDAREHRSRREHASRRTASFGARWTWFLANLGAPLLCALCAAFLTTAGILTSLSRGSFLSLTLGTVLTLAWRSLVLRFSVLSWVPLVVLAGAVGLVSWLGQSDTVRDRLETLTSLDSIRHDQRLTHWETALQAARDFEPLGSGLGTYRFAYTRYQTTPTDRTFYFAENQYIDTLVVGGGFGLLLLAAMWLLAAKCVHDLLRGARTSADQGIALTAALLLTTQTIHACFDFALYIPACYLTFAVLFGALFRRRAVLLAAPDSVAAPSRFGFAAALAAGLLLLGGLACGTHELFTAWVSRTALRETTMRADQKYDAAWLAEAADKLKHAVALAPDDGELYVRAAEVEIERYRDAFRRELQKVPVEPWMWQWESPLRLHADAHLLARIQDDASLAKLRQNPLIVQYLKPALAAARQARRLCPLSPYAHLIAAQLCFLDESPLDDGFYLDRAERLAGGRTDRLFEIGALHIDAARLDRGWAAWRRSWELSPKHEAVIVRIGSAFLTPENLLKKVVPQSTDTLMRVARNYFREPDQEHSRHAFYRRALELMATDPNPSAENCRQAAVGAIELNDLAAAARWYERALGLDDSRADWFFESAELAIRRDDWDTAAAHARLALRLEPNNGRYRDLLTRVWNEIEERKNPQTPSNRNP